MCDEIDWAYCKYVLKKKIKWAFIFIFKTSSLRREKKRYKVDQDKVQEWIQVDQHTKLEDVPYGIVDLMGMVSNRPYSFVN